MFSRSGIPLLTFLQNHHVWVTSKIQINFRFKTYSEVLVNVSYRFLKFLHATSCHVMPCHVPHVTSCHVMPCHVMSRHVTSRLAPSCHVMPRHVMSRHVISWHVTSGYVISCRKSRDSHTTNAPLSTDFFHMQLIQIKHDRVRWLSRRLPIPYRISGIWSSYCYYIVSIYDEKTESEKIFEWMI